MTSNNLSLTIRPTGLIAHDELDVSRAIESKKCTTCGLEKPLSEFHRSAPHKGGRHSQCNRCFREVQHKWTESHPKEQKEYREGLRRAGYLRVVDLKRRYGMTVDDYANLFSAQRGKCAICGIGAETLSIDHDHKTSKVRGLLCKKCNLLLGYSGDDVQILNGAISYLKRNS